jgi:predicted small secreted protein
MMKKLSWLFLALFVITSCNTNESADSDIDVKQGERRSKLSSGSESAKELEAKAKKNQEAQEKKREERLANQTTMKITPNEFDFDDIPKGSPVSTVFTIKNTGDTPLTVNDAKASCGCTVPRKPEEPILPGEESDLEVTFTSKPNQAGSPINKKVTVTANIPGATKVVHIKGQVQN